MNCNCGKEISSPKLTGDLCTICFFKAKNQSINDTTRPKAVLESMSKMAANFGPYSTTPANTGMIVDIEEIGPEKPPTVSKSTEVKDPNLKYCQSCIERGYGLKLATREWQTDYFICDECFEPLLNNIMNIGDEEVKKIKSEAKPNEPFLNQAYDLLNIPEPLRFNKSDTVLNNRNDIFNYHAPTLINKDVMQIASEIEQLSILLFQIKLAIEPRQDYINKIKYSEREKAGLKGLEKSEKEYTKGPSKLKQSKDEKMAKQLGMTLEKYLEMAKSAKKTEFDKIVNS